MKITTQSIGCVNLALAHYISFFISPAAVLTEYGTICSMIFTVLAQSHDVLPFRYVSR
ncbi:hypothetical protein GBAR_LOCUS26022 [Geodia barretti]|uniref:Uncharacterized protein n=1 Tax=Geodia barretti TaxID=519541 RepID=A0AA35TFN7_GEOBA|nr:hypothetical protein GBAR_LOCUS26022 [Geodia barretti]